MKYQSARTPSWHHAHDVFVRQSFAYPSIKQYRSRPSTMICPRAFSYVICVCGAGHAGSYTLFLGLRIDSGNGAGDASHGAKWILAGEKCTCSTSS